MTTAGTCNFSCPSYIRIEWENVVPTDAVLARELRSLQEELATAPQQSPVQSADKVAESAIQTSTGPGTAASGGTAAPAGRPEEFADEQQLREEPRDLVKEITDFVEDAGRNVSAHPAMSVVAAMLLGILIGSPATDVAGAESAFSKRPPRSDIGVPNREQRLQFVLARERKTFLDENPTRVVGGCHRQT